MPKRLQAIGKLLAALFLCGCLTADDSAASCDKRIEEFFAKVDTLADKYCVGCSSDDDCVDVTPEVSCGPKSGFETCPVAVLAKSKVSFEKDMSKLSDDPSVCDKDDDCNGAPGCMEKSPKCVDSKCVPG